MDIKSYQASKNYTDKEVKTVNDRITTLTIEQHQKLTHKHRILMVEIDRNVPHYDLTFPEDAFAGGGLIEYCGFDAFVDNAEVWKNEFDILVMSTLTKIPYITKSTPTQIKSAIQTFMEKGVFVIYYSISTALEIRKYGANGVIDTAQTVQLGDLFGLNRSSKNIQNGIFQHSENYPFGDNEIIRTGAIPNNQYLSHFTSTDPTVVSPVIGVAGDITANCTAYKPNAFFIIGDGGSVSGDVNRSAFLNYIKGSELIRIATGKQKNVRLALDSIYGKRIASIGVDCCIDGTSEDFAPFTRAFNGKPIDFGICPGNVSDKMMSWFRSSFIEGQNFSICSHSHDHWNTTVTVTDEIHVVDDKQMIRLINPFYARITSIKLEDDSVTFTKCSVTTLNTSSPTIDEYAIEETTNGGIHQITGYVKFNSSRIGSRVKVSYTYVDEAEQNIRSLDMLKSKGVLTKKSLFQTIGHDSVHSTTLKHYMDNDITLCAYSSFPGYASGLPIIRGRTKHPLPVGTIAKERYNMPLIDTQYYVRTQAEARTMMETAISRCVQMDLPLAFYIHSFPLSLTHSTSLHNSVTFNSDWKGTTPAESQLNGENFMKWYVGKFDELGVHWLCRTDYAKRYYDMCKYLEYDVTEKNNEIIVTVRNSGNVRFNGLTFRIPSNTEPTKVELLEGQNVNYEYTDGVIYAWFDVLPGQTVSLEISSS